MEGDALWAWLIATIASFCIALSILSHSFEQWAVWPQVFERDSGSAAEAARAALICAAQVGLAVPVSYSALGWASSALSSATVLVASFVFLAI